MGFLIEHFDLVPHRDFFDMNLIGSYLSYATIGRLFGYSAQAIRCADFMVMAIIVSLTIFVMRPIGFRAAWLAGVMFLLKYLTLGPVYSLQREVLMLVPLLLGVLPAVLCQGTHIQGRIFLSGMAIGLAALVKPPVVLALVPLGIFFWSESCQREQGKIKNFLQGVKLGGWMSLGVFYSFGVRFN